MGMAKEAENRFAMARWPAVAAVAYLVCSLPILGCRNLYDDELGSFWLIERPLADLWQTANSGDVHPPGMYVLAKLAAFLIPHERWMAVVPLALCAAGLWASLRLLAGAAAREGQPWHPLALVAAALAPQWLLWTNSIRWYAWWSPAALVLLSLVASRRVRSIPSVVLGVVLGGLTYVSYLTVLLGLCTAGVDTIFALTACSSRRAAAISSLKYWATAGAVGVSVASFQIPAFVGTHLPHSAAQRGAFLATALQLGHGVLQSDAFLPWSFGGLACACLLGVGLIRAGFGISGQPVRTRLIALLVAISALGLLTGLGVKPRSFAVLSPMVTLVATDCLLSWTRRGNVVIARLVAVLVLLIPALATANMIRREGLMKAAMADKPEQVVKALEDFERLHASASTVVFVRDPGVTYHLALARSEGRLASSVPCALRPGSLPSRLRPFVSESCKGEFTHAAHVVGYLGSDLPFQQRFERFGEELEAAGPVAMDVSVSPDPDAELKRRFATLFPRAGDLPAMRFRVTCRALGIPGAADDLVHEWSRIYGQ